jgi:hypothetical protein
MSLRDERNIARAAAHLETKLRIEAETVGRTMQAQRDRAIAEFKKFVGVSKEAIAATKALTVALEILIHKHPYLQEPDDDTGLDFENLGE